MRHSRRSRRRRDPGRGTCCFSRDGHHAYLTLEMVGEVAVYDYAQGRLTQKQRVSLAPPASAGRTALPPCTCRRRRFLYVTNRGNDNQLVTFAVAPRAAS
jgi:6-phosphogluconolactonase (cycloisomerase 2 family)